MTAKKTFERFDESAFELGNHTVLQIKCAETAT